MSDQTQTTVGYITPTIYSPYHRLLLTGVQRAARERSVRLVIFHMTTDAAMRSLPLWQSVNGWVISYSDLNCQEFSDAARPFVMVSQAVAGAPVVVIDNRSGMRAAVITGANSAASSRACKP